MAELDAETFRRLLDASPLGVVVHDETGRIVHANVAFAALLGYTIAEVQSVNVLSIFQSAAGFDAAGVPGQAGPSVAGAAGAAGAGSTAVETGVQPSPIGVIADRMMVHRTGLPIRCRTATSATTEPDGRLVMICVQDIGAQEQRVAKWRHAATHDPLTGLFNRAGMNLHLERLVAAGRTVDLAMIDLDGLKQVNDTLGHPAGDRLLEAVAGILATGLPPGCVGSRWAGDEFVVTGPLLDPARPQDSPDLAATLRQCLREGVEVAPGIRVPVRASVGVAACSPTQPPAQAIAQADIAMYAMKQARSRSSDTVPMPRQP